MQNFIFVLLFSITFLNAQTNNWWIFFNNKDCVNSISLSSHSITKRSKKNINLDFYDFSICQDYIDSLKKHKISIRNPSRWLNAVSISVEDAKVLDTILKYDFIKKIQPVAKIVNHYEIPNITSQSRSHFFQVVNQSMYGISFNQINMLGGVDLHAAGFLGNDIVIAVFDAGFTGVESLPIFHHLWDNNQILDVYDFVDQDSDVFHASSHGMRVLSTMGGYMLDSLIGTAPGASYMLFRTEDTGSETLIEEDNWAAAAEYADSVGVDIINSSLGYTILYDDTLNSHSYSDMDGNSTIITNAADRAAAKGILVVNSAGNSGNNSWYYIGAPADGDSVLAIGAVNSVGDIASFSSRGPSYDGRIKPNVCAQGVEAVVADLDSTIRFANGTSFSAPIIAGLSACLWQSNMNLSNMDLFNIIQESAHLFNNPNDSLGYGVPQFYEAYLNTIRLDNQRDDLAIYPNPFNECFYISNKSELDYSVEIFNIFGQSIMSKQNISSNSTVLIDELLNFPVGYYVLKKADSYKLYPIIKIREK